MYSRHMNIFCSSLVLRFERKGVNLILLWWLMYKLVFNNTFLMRCLWDSDWLIDWFIHSFIHWLYFCILKVHVYICKYKWIDRKYVIQVQVWTLYKMSYKYTWLYSKTMGSLLYIIAAFVVRFWLIAKMQKTINSKSLRAMTASKWFRIITFGTVYTLYKQQLKFSDFYGIWNYYLYQAF